MSGDDNDEGLRAANARLEFEMCSIPDMTLATDSTPLMVVGCLSTKF